MEKVHELVRERRAIWGFIRHEWNGGNDIVI